MTDLEWIQWDGGDCPVPGDARVLLTYRDGTKSKIREAGELRWQHERLCDDIMSYAVVPA